MCCVNSVVQAIVAALIAGLALSACANKQPMILWLRPASPRQAASRTSSSTSATASSSRSNSTELTATSRGTLDKQAQWLQQYGNYTFTIEGHADERGTREYNIALGARRAQAVRDYLASRGIQRRPHAHRLLRQGTPGRGLQRHLVLVAEPPRRDGSRRHLLERAPPPRSTTGALQKGAGLLFGPWPDTFWS